MVIIYCAVLYIYGKMHINTAIIKMRQYLQHKYYHSNNQHCVTFLFYWDICVFYTLGSFIECKHPYPQTVNEFQEYNKVTCHFLYGDDESDDEEREPRAGYSVSHYTCTHCTYYSTSMSYTCGR